MRGAAFPVTVFGLIWAGFIQTFFYEWWVNEQYSYGFFVPLLTAYLVVLRWEDRPSPAPPVQASWYWVIPLGAVLLFTPLRIVLEANPEWRAALWFHALLCFGATLSLIGAVGGIPWIRHFAVPLSLILFAVPWPMPLEQPLVHGLMSGVAGITVEALNLAGYYAEQEGNLIRLTSGLIGVEEACSGVRSFQSTLMVAFFLGELFRWQWRYRLALVFAGCTVSLLLNLGRTLTLTLVAIKRGSEAMEAVHDPLGHLVSLGSFCVLLILTWLLHLRYRGRNPRKVRVPHRASVAPLAMTPGAVMIIAFLTQFPLAYLWYADNRIDAEARTLVEIDWNHVAPGAEETPIAPSVRAILRYSEGEQMDFRWRDEFWTGFLFRWEAGRISSHVAVHRPEVCLPAAGFKLVGRGEPLTWSDGPLEIIFTSSVYRAHAHDYYVFHAMWDTAPSRRVPLASNWSDRLSNAWKGLRINERQSLEVIIVGPEGIEAATQRMHDFLGQTLRVRRT